MPTQIIENKKALEILNKICRVWTDIKWGLMLKDEDAEQDDEEAVWRELFETDDGFAEIEKCLIETFGENYMYDTNTFGGKE